MPRGGNRQGKAQTAYANRTDLNQPALPITTVPGQTYGAAGAQKAAQAAIPMSGTPVIPGGGNPTPQGQPAPTAPPPPHPFAPTEMPQQDLMHGVGVNQPALPAPADPAFQMLTLLNSLGDSTDAQTNYIKTYLQLQAQNQMPH